MGTMPCGKFCVQNCWKFPSKFCVYFVALARLVKCLFKPPNAAANATSSWFSASHGIVTVLDTLHCERYTLYRAC